MVVRQTGLAIHAGIAKLGCLTGVLHCSPAKPNGNEKFASQCCKRPISDTVSLRSWLLEPKTALVLYSQASRAISTG